MYIPDHIGVDAVQLRLDSGRGLSVAAASPSRARMALGQGTLTLVDGRWELITLSDGGGMFDNPQYRGVRAKLVALRNTAGQSALLRAEPRSEAPSVGADRGQCAQSAGAGLPA